MPYLCLCHLRLVSRPRVSSLSPLPPPLRPPLFPYTTLFRSAGNREHRELYERNVEPGQPRRHGIRSSGGAAGRADRKSTRLNSSHLGISYAVFCLKKKNKKNNTYHTHDKQTENQTRYSKHED